MNYLPEYVSWHLAHTVLDKFDQVTDGLQIRAVPVLAGLRMVMWDMSMDPARSTLAEAWIWHDGGGYFDVPVESFMGWRLYVWTIFHLSSILPVRQSRTNLYFIRVKTTTGMTRVVLR